MGRDSHGNGRKGFETAMIGLSVADKHGHDEAGKTKYNSVITTIIFMNEHSRRAKAIILRDHVDNLDACLDVI